jgi:hypothetical protein
MTKKIQDIAVAFFFVSLGVCLLIVTFWLKPVIESQQRLAESTRSNQEALMKGAEETKTIVTELGYAVAIIAMTENKMIPPAAANEMIDQSLKNINSHSDRLGKLAKILNDFRINQQSR